MSPPCGLLSGWRVSSAVPSLFGKTCMGTVCLNQACIDPAEHGLTRRRCARRGCHPRHSCAACWAARRFWDDVWPGLMRAGWTSNHDATKPSSCVLEE